jgi:hypothetical protein
MDETSAKLRAALAFTVRMLKSQARQISELSARIAVLAETVRGLDPTFDEVWESKKEDIGRMLSPSQQTLLDQYDELLRSIESGELL